MLTPKQEKFCQAIVDGKNNSEAYRSAYNTSKMKPETIHVKACELLKTGTVSVRIAELRAPVVEKLTMTLEQHVANLQELKRLATAAGNFGAAVTAETNAGKALGHYVERVDMTARVSVKKIEIELVKPT
jgi:phage terminase small subunit